MCSRNKKHLEEKKGRERGEERRIKVHKKKRTFRKPRRDEKRL